MLIDVQFIILLRLHVYAWLCGYGETEWKKKKLYICVYIYIYLSINDSKLHLVRRKIHWAEMNENWRETLFLYLCLRIPSQDKCLWSSTARSVMYRWIVAKVDTITISNQTNRSFALFHSQLYLYLYLFTVCINIMESFILFETFIRKTETKETAQMRLIGPLLPPSPVKPLAIESSIEKVCV